MSNLCFDAVPVSPNVWWVGARDWSVRNFHGYETNRGSSYNAFLVIDEKVTVIDAVKAPFVPEMLARIASVIDPATQADFRKSLPQQILKRFLRQQPAPKHWRLITDLKISPPSRPVTAFLLEQAALPLWIPRCCTGPTAW